MKARLSPIWHRTTACARAGSGTLATDHAQGFVLNQIDGITLVAIRDMAQVFPEFVNRI
ncbi:MAG: hypothetical protein IH868_11620 [Chloroflexi bacterium]|nr:hypothetical protein [Chloroflexota bacterium]